MEEVITGTRFFYKQKLHKNYIWYIVHIENLEIFFLLEENLNTQTEEVFDSIYHKYW